VFFIAVTLGAVSSLPVCAADMEVNIDNFAFTPKELTVKAGTAIVFRNRDDIPHSGTKGEFHSKALDTDDSFSFTFTKAGTYGYSCGLHPQMQGRIIVTP
jgi:plastocyanin